MNEDLFLLFVILGLGFTGLYFIVCPEYLAKFMYEMNETKLSKKEAIDQNKKSSSIAGGCILSIVLFLLYSEIYNK